MVISYRARRPVMKDHAGLQRNIDVVIEAEDVAFAPIRREEIDLQPVRL
jgi:hypothetical protein